MNLPQSMGKPAAQLGMRSSLALDRPAQSPRRQFALAGLKTLLVDAKRFPREKVCGGYLNSRALEVLRQAGLALVAADWLANQR